MKRVSVRCRKPSRVRHARRTGVSPTLINKCGKLVSVLTTKSIETFAFNLAFFESKVCN